MCILSLKTFMYKLPMVGVGPRIRERQRWPSVELPAWLRGLDKSQGNGTPHTPGKATGIPALPRSKVTEDAAQRGVEERSGASSIPTPDTNGAKKNPT